MKCFFILLVTLSVCPSYAQEIETPIIKQLKKKLPSTQASSTVDRLLNICEQYFDQGFFGDKDPRTDSIMTLAGKARLFAEKLNYKKGISHSMVFTGFVKMVKRDFHGAENDLKNVLHQKSLPKKMLGHAAGLLNAIYWEYHRNFEEAERFAQLSLQQFQASGDKKQEALTCVRLGGMYQEKEDLMKAVEFYGKAANLGKKIIQKQTPDGWTDMMYLQPLNALTQLYILGGDYATAKEFLHQTEAYIQKRKLRIYLNHEWANIYSLEGKYDSAAHFLQVERKRSPEVILSTWELGKTYLEAKDYGKALYYLQQASDTFRSRIGQPNRPRPKLNLLQTLISTAKAHHGLNDLQKAKATAEEGLKLLQQNRNKFTAMQQSELFADAYRFTGNYDSALVYYQRFKFLQDSLISKQFLFKLNNLKRAAADERNAIQMALLKKQNELKGELLRHEQLLKKERENQIVLLDLDNRLKGQQLVESQIKQRQKEASMALLYKDNQLKQQQLKQEAFVKRGLIMGLAGIILISLILTFTLSLKRKNEKLRREKAESFLKIQQLEHAKKQSQLQQQASELEMQALRAQMNPHFIFNCLSSINWLIIGNHPDAASDYLTRFSKLIRMVLVNSEKALISLEEELKMLELYLDMEQLRFENSFDYEIKYGPDLFSEAISVPPLLFQPFCENAIRHGLMKKEGRGKLSIQLNEEDENLYCTISDNGIGRAEAKKASGHLTDHHSMGLKITAARIALFNEKRTAHTMYEIEDLIDKDGNAAGTRVMIKIKNRKRQEHAFEV